MLDITDEEMKKIGELRKRAEDALYLEEHKEDIYLIRWLRARDLDVDKAEEMLRKSHEWRKAEKVDGILERETIPQEFLNMFPIGLCGADHTGRPIFLVPMGEHDFDAMLKEHGKDQCLRWHVANCEKMMQVISQFKTKDGKRATQLVEIMDMRRWSIGQIFKSKAYMDFMMESQKLFDLNYPEVLGFCLCINAPSIITLLMAIMRPIVSKRTFEKIQICGKNAEKWKQVIRDTFPIDKIPPHWGGTLEGSDEFCSQSDIWLEGPVPLAHFTGADAAYDDDDGWVTVNVGARDKHVLQFDMNVDDVLTWAFRSEGHDMAFGVKKNEGRRKEPKKIIATARVESQNGLIEGSWTCDIKGTYDFIFDNSYSMTRAKTVHYKIGVELPGGQTVTLD